jgi:putative redox protein
MRSEVKVTVGGLQSKMRLVGKGHAGQTIQLDMPQPLGDDDGFTGLETLLVSLCGCSGHTVLYLLKKMGRTVETLEIQAMGQRRDEHPTILTDIELQYNLKGDTLDAPSVEKAIKMAEETYCPVWAMLKNDVAISWNYSIT